MGSKTFYYVATIVGGIIGSFVPALWGGGGLLSVSSLVFSTLGALLALYLTWKFFNG